MISNQDSIPYYPAEQKKIFLIDCSTTSFSDRRFVSLLSLESSPSRRFIFGLRSSLDNKEQPKTISIYSSSYEHDNETSI